MPENESETGTTVPATAAGVFGAPNVAAVLRRAADDLESRPWLKPVEALRLWADALEMEARNGE